MKQINYLLFFLILIFFENALAQYSTTHHIAPAPWKYWSQANEIVIGTKTPNQNVTVQISKSDGSPVTNFVVTENNPISYRFEGLVTASSYNPINTILESEGLIITADFPIMINLRNIASDITGSTVNNIKGNASLVSFGGEGLGNEFLLGYYRTSTAGLSMAGSSVAASAVYSVLATEDSTIISLPTGDITLNEGESYLFTAPIGYRLIANKLVVVNVGSYGDTPQTCGSNGQDGTFDQVAPVHSLGNQYLVVRGEGTAPTTSQANLFYGSEQSVIIASQPNTVITITNFSPAGLLINTINVTLANSGDFHTFYHGDGQNPYSSSLISSTYPVVVYAGTAVNCETDISTVLPIGGCSGALNVQTKKFINYNSQNLPYFGFTVIESVDEPVYMNGLNLETLTGNNRIALGTSGFYLLMFNNINVGNPENVIITSDLPLTSSLVQQGDGFSMSAFFSSFGELAEPPVVGLINSDCSVSLTTDPGYTQYKWYLNGVEHQTTTTNTITITETGNYSVQYLKDCGFSGISVPKEIIVTPCADLALTKEISDENYSQVTFRITVRNTNPHFVSENVIVNDVLPAGYTYVSSNATQGSYNQVNGIWTIGNINPNQTVQLSMVCNITPENDYNNIATVSSGTNDPNNRNNVDNAGVSMLVADVDAFKDDGIEYYRPGDEITYNIRIINNGPSVASNIQVRDPFPEGITFMTWNNSLGRNGVNQLSDTIDLLRVGEYVDYNVTIKVPFDFTGDLVNTVYYESEYYDDPKPECTKCTDIDYMFPIIPKGISPNNDGKNDRLNLKGYRILQLFIYNRHGKEVYSKKLYTDEWEGQSNSGEKLPTGTYFYVIKALEGKEFKGYIELNY